MNGAPGIVAVVAHRPSALAGVDQVLVMGGGRVQAVGPKDEILRKAIKVAPPAPPPTAQKLPMSPMPTSPMLKVVANQEQEAP